MSSLFKIYNHILVRYPMACQSVQAGILMGAGDFISQTLVEKKPLANIEIKRTVQFFSLGTFFIGPTLTVWYRALAKHVGTGGKKGAALKKVAMDQLLFAPICTFFVLTTINTMQGNSYEKIKRNVEDEYWTVLIANYKIWPAVQLANFYFVPLNYQVLVVQVVALFWNAFLSYTTRPKD